jgi:hypothetical protein
MFIYDAAMKYMAAGVPTVIFAGEEYGTGSSRDWAAKGTQLLGIKAVVARSFERIHRSNLVGMGVLPLQFKAGDSWETLGLRGDETDRRDPRSRPAAAKRGQLVITAPTAAQALEVTLRIDTPIEVDYYRAGGILPFVLRQLLAGVVARPKALQVMRADSGERLATLPLGAACRTATAHRTSRSTAPICTPCCWPRRRPRAQRPCAQAVQSTPWHRLRVRCRCSWLTRRGRD